MNNQAPNHYQIQPGLSSVQLFGRGKNKKQPQQPTQENPAASPIEPASATKPQKSLIVARYEFAQDTLKFLTKQGLFSKKWVAIMEIPVLDISKVDAVGNEIGITWNANTQWFSYPKKTESFNKLRDELNVLLEEHRQTEQQKQKALQKKSDLTTVISASVGAVDLSFDILMGLQLKRVDWRRLIGYTEVLNLNFRGQALEPLTVDFSKVSAAVKSEVPKEAIHATFEALKQIYGYFDSLKPEEKLPDVHPSFADARAVILAYYMLNDLLLAKVVGDKDTAKEDTALEAVLDKLDAESRL